MKMLGFGVEIGLTEILDTQAAKRTLRAQPNRRLSQPLTRFRLMRPGKHQLQASGQQLRKRGLIFQRKPLGVFK